MVYKKVMIHCSFFKGLAIIFIFLCFQFQKHHTGKKTKNKCRPQNDINYCEGIVSLSLLR